jgi:hypothetical protein
MKNLRWGKGRRTRPPAPAPAKGNHLAARIASERTMPAARKREAYLRGLMDLPSRVFSDGTSIRDEP